MAVHVYLMVPVHTHYSYIHHVLLTLHFFLATTSHWTRVAIFATVFLYSLFLLVSKCSWKMAIASRLCELWECYKYVIA